MNNRTRATTTNNPFLLPKSRRAASGNDGWDFRCAEKKGENPPPLVRLLVKACATGVTQSSDWTFWKSRRYSKVRNKRGLEYSKGEQHVHSGRTE